jgi:hypothetical protein
MLFGSIFFEWLGWGSASCFIFLISSSLALVILDWYFCSMKSNIVDRSKISNFIDFWWLLLDLASSRIWRSLMVCLVCLIYDLILCMTLHKIFDRRRYPPMIELLCSLSDKRNVSLQSIVDGSNLLLHASLKLRLILKLQLSIVWQYFPLYRLIFASINR